MKSLRNIIVIMVFLAIGAGFFGPKLWKSQYVAPRRALAERQPAPDETRQPVAAEITRRVVQDGRKDDHHPRRSERRPARSRQREESKADSRRGDQREYTVARGLVAFELSAQQPMDKTPRRNGQKDDFHDLAHHLDGVDLDEAPGEHLHHQGRHERRKKR